MKTLQRIPNALRNSLLSCGVAVILIATATACDSSPAPMSDAGSPDAGAPDAGMEDPSARVARAATLLTGRFDSSAQASSNPSYFPVQLITCPVEVAALGETVLYVEQALVDNPGSPYRQRLYVLTAEGEQGVVSEVYSFNAPASFIGFCDGNALETPVAEDVQLRAGCAVHLVEDLETGSFSGSTDGTSCGSTLMGASYATSEVELTESRITSWDRGYDDSGSQVWGATAGAYIFDRRP